MLTVQWEVILEHECREFRRLEWVGLHKDFDGGLSGGDRSASHAMAAYLVPGIKWVGRVAR